MSSSSEIKMQNLLDAVTVALQNDDDIEQLTKHTTVPRNEADSFINMIQSLHESLVHVEPSAKFAANLESELMGTRSWMVVTKVRQMPARVHIAAILAVAAGFVVVAYRRLFGSPVTQDITEETVTV